MASDHLRPSVSRQLAAVIPCPGGIFSRTRDKPSDFVKADFIEAVKGNIVDFNYGGKEKALFNDVTVDDALSIGALLRRLSDEQIRDAFRGQLLS